MDYKNDANISHLFSDVYQPEMPDELLEYRDYLGHVIKAATATDDLEFLSPVPCRKRVNRKPCDGFIAVKKQSIPGPFIYWHCTSCDDGGRIANWKGCPYDHSEFMEPAIEADDEPNPMVEVKVSRDEMGALLTGMLYDFSSERIIYSARPNKKSIVMRGLYGAMDNFIGFLASDANHEENKKRQKLLDSLYEKVESATNKAYEECGLGD